MKFKTNSRTQIYMDTAVVQLRQLKNITYNTDIFIYV